MTLRRLRGPRLWRRLALLLAGVVLLTAQSVSTACPAGACSCVPANPEVVARDAAYIAKVRVDRVTGSQSDDNYVFTVVPEALYKGPDLAPTTIATRTATTACGLGRWEVGGIAMIVAYPASGNTAGKAAYEATWCSLISAEDADRVLGPPRTQVLPPPPRPPLFEPWQVAVIGAGVVTLAGLGVALLMVSRRRSRGRTDDDGRS